jgi:NhaP-type Na+/H+ or K+/H+ antiporter
MDGVGAARVPVRPGREGIMEPGRSPEDTLRTRVLRLNAMATGVAFGVLVGLGLFVATNWLILKGGENVGPHLALLGQFFIGYKVTFLGSVIGLGYGFVSGFVVGFMIAALHNRFADQRRRRQSGARA